GHGSDAGSSSGAAAGATVSVAPESSAVSSAGSAGIETSPESSHPSVVTARDSGSISSPDTYDPYAPFSAAAPSAVSRTGASVMFRASPSASVLPASVTFATETRSYVGSAPSTSVDPTASMSCALPSPVNSI